MEVFLSYSVELKHKFSLQLRLKCQGKNGSELPEFLFLTYAGTQYTKFDEDINKAVRFKDNTRVTANLVRHLTVTLKQNLSPKKKQLIGKGMHHQDATGEKIYDLNTPEATVQQDLAILQAHIIAKVRAKILPNIFTLFPPYEPFPDRPTVEDIIVNELDVQDEELQIPTEIVSELMLAWEREAQHFSKQRALEAAISSGTFNEADIAAFIRKSLGFEKNAVARRNALIFVKERFEVNSVFDKYVK